MPELGTRTQGLSIAASLEAARRLARSTEIAVAPYCSLVSLSPHGRLVFKVTGIAKQSVMVQSRHS